MSEKDMKRMQIYAQTIAELRAAADDDSLTKEWKLWCFREIFKSHDAALAALEEE